MQEHFKYFSSPSQFFCILYDFDFVSIMTSIENLVGSQVPPTDSIALSIFDADFLSPSENPIQQVVPLESSLFRLEPQLFLQEPPLYRLKLPLFPLKPSLFPLETQLFLVVPPLFRLKPPLFALYPSLFPLVRSLFLLVPQLYPLVPPALASGQSVPRAVSLPSSDSTSSH